MTIQDADYLFKVIAKSIYGDREGGNIADWVMERLTGLKKSERLIYQSKELDQQQMKLADLYSRDLSNHKPVQYVLNEAWFCGMKLYVDENVLIPRPETEELVEWVAASKGSRFNGKILDVGTGSGCIPIALKNKLPQADIYSCDVSEKALTVAARNAADQNVSVHFILLDFLIANARETLPQVDLLVSNPPYVPLKDKDAMSKNVVSYEPHIALFVQNDDPFIFYRVLAEFAKTHLIREIFVEIHEDLANGVQELFRSKGFTYTELKKDMQGKDRMIRAATP